MNLSKKKKLAARTFGVGKERIKFVDSRKSEIKEAITKQDVRDLMNSGAIIIKDIKGRRKKITGGKRGQGKVRKNINKRKTEYVKLSRKLRGYVGVLKREGKISNDEFKEIRKNVKNKLFRSKAHLKLHIQSLKSK